VKKPLQVLFVEDSENDAALLQLELEREGYETNCRRVETAHEMAKALDEQRWDVVIADYVMPKFSGLDALALVKSKGLDLPFIIVSGHITEDTAVAAMKAGAHDYVMKDKPQRLAPAVQRELREAEVRRQRRRSEETIKVEHAITRVLAGADSLEDAIQQIVHLLIEGLDVDIGTFWVVEGKQLLPFTVNTRSDAEFLQPFVEEGRRLSFGADESLPGRVWRNRRPEWLTNLAALPGGEIGGRRELAVKAGLISAMAFPVQSAGRILGVFEFFASRHMDDDPDLLNMMTAIGSEIGQFIRRRRAEEDLRRAHDELETRVQQRTAELKTANTSLHAAIQERKRLEHELLEITENERRRIGLDLHDDLGQKLSGIALMSKGLEIKLSKTRASEAKDAAKIHTFIQEAISHTRDVARHLATLDLRHASLPAALEGLAEHAQKTFEITCRFKAEGPIPPLDSNVVTQLYKIAQEAVTNAIKHGKAHKVGISLANGSDRVVLKIQNDGKPFPDLNSGSTGMGLRIMNYRASLIGASLEIKGAGKGTRVTCSMPVESKK
jgi:signal transduction histidine kinase/CheY-like chemotaxis protein